MSSHSILSKFVSGRSRDRQELLVVNCGSDVSMGEWEWSKMLEWLSRSFWRSSIKENDSLSSLLFVSWGISLPDGKVPSRRASSWFSKLTDKLVVGSKDTGGGAIWICGGGRDITVFTGIVVMLAVTGLILEMGDGSSFIGREISVIKNPNTTAFRKDNVTYIIRLKRSDGLEYPNKSCSTGDVSATKNTPGSIFCSSFPSKPHTLKTFVRASVKLST